MHRNRYLSPITDLRYNKTSETFVMTALRVTIRSIHAFHGSKSKDPPPPSILKASASTVHVFQPHQLLFARDYLVSCIAIGYTRQ